MNRNRPLVVLLAILGLLSAGCGLKPEVSEQLATSGGGGFEAGVGGPSSGTSGTGGATGRPGAGATGGGATTGGGTGGTGAAVEGGPAGGGDPAAGDPAAGGGGPSAGGGAAVEGDRTGISDTEIVIGIHAPVTGAAPFPQNSFEVGKDIYFQFLNATRGGVHNRQIRVVFRDDGFDPRTAVGVCREMVEEDHAFLLIGGGGSDQIGACAEYANSVGVPYLSAGVQSARLDQLRGYFAVSMTYAQQAPLLVQLIQSRFAGQNVAVLVAEGENLDDYYEAQLQALRSAGIEPVLARRIPKNTSAGDGLTIINQLRTNQADVVVWNASPVSFLSTASQAPNAEFQWMGPGITNGLNTVAEVGCSNRAIEGALFFSPFPQLDAIDSLDPDFSPAYRQYAGDEPDDLGIALWGLDKVVAAMFEAAGPDMSRQSLVALLESGQPFQTGVFPPVQYSAESHFGGSQVHLLQADCSTRMFKTVATFAGGF